MRNNLWLIALCLLALSPSYAQRTIYVSKGGSNNSPYLNWPDAATNIQAAINVATNSDVVQLSNDVYVSTGIYNSNSFLFITSGITLRGFSAQSPTDTVIDGGNPAVTNGCIYMNHANARVEHVWVRNGYTTVSNINKTAGGVYIQNGTISNCWVTHCTNALVGAGGVVINNGLLTDCMISNNLNVRTATSGAVGNGVQAGGVLMAGGNIYNSQIVSNRSVNCSGGGVLVSGGSGAISNCNISYNKSGSGGGGISYYPQKVYNCTIIGNYAAGTGGGIGTAISVDIANCSVISNSCVAWGGGISCDADINVTMKNCLFYANSAGNAGGVSWRTASNNSKMESCTIVSNVATTHSGGIRNYMGATQTNSLFLNCIVYFNSAGTVGNDFYSTGADPSLDQQFQYCCINSNLSKAIGLVTANPQLVNLASGDCRLNANSPCHNAGSNQSWMATAKDLAGNPRIDHFNNNVDIGAYEFFYKGMILMGH